ncbi:MAG TPA: DUF3379 family protein [Steroidobacteraceae bacterium]|nr:DUF3379 family protein [Steroidobacteraceae bacterium]
MTCEDARLLIGAAPESLPRELEEHLRGCDGCQGFRREMLLLDADIRRALERGPPDIAAVRVLRAPAPAWRRYALAASAVLASVVALAVWVLRPSDTLAHEVVTHVEGEPQSWLATQHVSAASIDHALRGGGVVLGVSSDRIVYAQSCWFRGHYVPHLVVETTDGPATVLVLRHEQPRAPERFQEAGMSGIIVPVGEGSIAVLARGGGTAAVEQLAGEMQRGLRWMPEPQKR